MDVVVGDVGQIRWREVELRRVDVLALGALRGQVEIGSQRPAGIVGGEFDAVLPAIAVVERRQDDRRAELALVDQVVPIA